MDVLPHDVLLQILVKTDSETLSKIFPRLSLEMKDRVGGATFWSARLQAYWPEKLKVIRDFEELTQESINLDLAARLVEHGQLQGCHLVLSALALESFPSLEVIAAALALNQNRSYLDETEEGALVAAILKCCSLNPQHLGRVLSYLCAYYPTVPHNSQRLSKELGKDLNNLRRVLDTMSDCRAWHAQVRYLGLLMEQAAFSYDTVMSSFLVTYAHGKHYYHLLAQTRLDLAKHQRCLQFFEDLLEEFSPLPLSLHGHYWINYQYGRLYDSNADYLPTENYLLFPTPLVGMRTIRGGPELGQSIFSYDASQLVQLLAEGLDVVGWLKLEVDRKLPWPAQVVRYCGFVTLYHLLASEDPLSAAQIFTSDLLKNWALGNGSYQGCLMRHFLDNLSPTH